MKKFPQKNFKRFLYIFFLSSQPFYRDILAKINKLLKKCNLHQIFNFDHCGWGLGGAGSKNVTQQRHLVLISLQCGQSSALRQRFSTQITPRPVFPTTYNFIVFFINPIEGCNPFKILHDLYQVATPGG